MDDLDVVIVGAGPSGLQALRECLKHGLTARCLEKAASVGGKWTGHGIYNCVLIQQHKEEFRLPEMPWHQDIPDFPARENAMEVVYSYVHRYGLEKHVDCRSAVESAVYDEGTGLWTTTTSKGTAWTSRFLVFAVGSLVKPSFPKQVQDALAKFSGDVVHAHDYFRPLPFHGKRVVVLGMGSSGVEISQDLARNGSCASVTMVAPPKKTSDGKKRHGHYWVLSRELQNGASKCVTTGKGDLNLRNQKVLDNMKVRHPQYPECLPPLLRPSGVLEGRVACPGEDGRPLGGGVVVSEGFLDCVSDGSVTCAPGFIEDSEGTALSIALDGEDDVQLEADAVIVCTGYGGPTACISSITTPPPNDCDTSLYKATWMPDCPNTACIGHLFGFTAVPATAYLQARYVARVASGKVKLPPPETMWEWLHEVQRKMSTTQRLTRDEYWSELKDEWIGGADDSVWHPEVENMPAMCEACESTMAAEEALHFWPPSSATIFSAGACHDVMEKIKERLTKAELASAKFVEDENCLEDATWPVGTSSADLIVCDLLSVLPVVSVAREAVRGLKCGGHAIMAVPQSHDNKWEQIFDELEHPHGGTQWRLQHKTAPRVAPAKQSAPFRIFVFKRQLGDADCRCVVRHGLRKNELGDAGSSSDGDESQ